ncbi:uncharacterized protein F4817DRAFT_360253 [Daldinia loculata]|uniref:uncharacterized protein n=1 Tax=Daldinia loculata TaxID=103429 RepID=UPI0020C5028E|nr:uncharacterized protein F4817DRAFT_360253 [Daldinia loculata]KAI1645182.1 hypothetical protein F4817DRAFT_360253 [Daldinia loculata]
MSSPEEIESLLNGPALPPPDGVEPNFEDPPNHNALGYGLLSAMLAVGTIAMFFRILARVLFVVYLGCAYQVLKFPGFYVHQWDVRVRDMERILYPFNIASNSYNGMIGALKVAILLEWLRIFNPTGTRGTFFWACHIILWINLLFYAASFFAINLACIPRQKIWDKTISGGHCFNQNDLYLAGTIVNLISDVAILIIPQRVIWSLQMTFKRKIGISLIFAIGLLCCGIAAARIATTLESAKEPDSVYYLPKLVFLGTAEMLCALLVFCFPAFPQAIKTLALPHSWDGSVDLFQQSSYSGGPAASYQQINEHSLEPLNKTEHDNKPRIYYKPTNTAM